MMDRGIDNKPQPVRIDRGRKQETSGRPPRSSSTSAPLGRPSRPSRTCCEERQADALHDDSSATSASVNRDAWSRNISL